LGGVVAVVTGASRETEATITLHTHGFDPGLGMLHTDKRYRGSLAHDLMEPVRPLVLLTDAGVIADADACRSWWKAEAVNGPRDARVAGNGIASGLWCLWFPKSGS
jgi:CRISPR associated protein Cas1